MNKKEYKEMSQKERVHYNNNSPSDKWFPPVWWVEISTSGGMHISKINKHKQVDGFFAGREQIKALYEAMSYLDEELHGKELTTDYFEEKYGSEPTEEIRGLQGKANNDG